MKLLWNDIEKKMPPDEKILIVAGPLGIDLAMKIDGQWYFKYGENWNQNNLECWCNFTPTQWAEFNFPEEETIKFQQEKMSGTGAKPDSKVFSEKDALQGAAELCLLAWI